MEQIRNSPLCLCFLPKAGIPNDLAHASLTYKKHTPLLYIGSRNRFFVTKRRIIFQNGPFSTKNLHFFRLEPKMIVVRAITDRLSGSLRKQNRTRIVFLRGGDSPLIFLRQIEFGSSNEEVISSVAAWAKPKIFKILA
jgi:hypothetical protein